MHGVGRALCAALPAACTKRRCVGVAAVSEKLPPASLSRTRPESVRPDIEVCCGSSSDVTYFLPSYLGSNWREVSDVCPLIE